MASYPKHLRIHWSILSFLDITLAPLVPPTGAQLYYARPTFRALLSKRCHVCHWHSQRWPIQPRPRTVYITLASIIGFGFGIDSCNIFVHQRATSAEVGSFEVPPRNLQQRRTRSLLNDGHFDSRVVYYIMQSLNMICNLTRLLEALIPGKCSILDLMLKSSFIVINVSFS